MRGITNQTVDSTISPSDRSLRARIAAHARWAAEADRAAATEPGRRAFQDRFDRQVDPDGVLPPEERARRAAHARSAYFSSLALKSARSRRAQRRSPSASRLADATARSSAAEAP
jgi:hypothetical protein